MTTTETVRPHTLGEALTECAKYADGTPERLYWGGVVFAFVHAEGGLSLNDEYENLTLTQYEGMLAQPLPFPQAHMMVGALGRSWSRVNQPRLYRACGALWGFLEATAHYDDVAECAMCGRRIFPTGNDRFPATEGITECERHGWVHDGDCATALCGVEDAPEREFDKDAYYDRKYGG